MSPSSSTEGAAHDRGHVAHMQTTLSSRCAWSLIIDRRHTLGDFCLTRRTFASLRLRYFLDLIFRASISQQDVRDSYVRSTVFMPSCAMTDANICKALPDITHALSLSLATSESDPCLRSSASEPESVFARRGRRPALRLRRCTNRASG